MAIINSVIKGGGITPTGTKSITSNGTHNVADYEYADVAVPTTAPAYYIEKTNNNGTLEGGSTFIDLTGITKLGDRALYCAYNGNTNLSGAIDLSNITQIGTSGLSNTFNNCPNITTVDLSSYKGDLNTNDPLQNAFNQSGITSLDLSSLEMSGGSSSMSGVCNGCSHLTTVDLRSFKGLVGSGSLSNAFLGCTSLTEVILGNWLWAGGNSGFQSTFNRCTGLTSINVGTILTIGTTGYSNIFSSTFYGCTGLTSVSFDNLLTITVSSAMNTTFRNCTNLSTLSFPSLRDSTNLVSGIFTNMLQGVTGCTVHFPSNLQTKMSSFDTVVNGFGGTNTTVLFDLPATSSALTLSCDVNTIANAFISAFKGNTEITSVDLSGIKPDFVLSRAQNNVMYSTFNNTFIDCTGITSADLSFFVGSDTVSDSSTYGIFNNTFSGCSSLTTVNLSSVKQFMYACFTNTFKNCTSLTELKFPALRFGYYGDSGFFSSIISGCSNVTVHFPSNMQSVIGPWASITNGLGGTNTTVLWDLPATNYLNGADSVDYERNPKYDTATALAWRVLNTAVSSTTYYTSGTTDPTVGTTIYSDSACTTAVTTVSSIS